MADNIFDAISLRIESYVNSFVHQINNINHEGLTPLGYAVRMRMNNINYEERFYKPVVSTSSKSSWWSS